MEETTSLTNEQKTIKLLESIDASLRSIKSGVTFFVIVTIFAIIINILF